MHRRRMPSTRARSRSRSITLLSRQGCMSICTLFCFRRGFGTREQAAAGIGSRERERGREGGREREHFIEERSQRMESVFFLNTTVYTALPVVLGDNVGMRSHIKQHTGHQVVYGGDDSGPSPRACLAPSLISDSSPCIVMYASAFKSADRLAHTDTYTRQRI